MAQSEQRTSPAPEDSAEASQDRLQALVSELLQTNQELRFKIALLEERAESAERGLKKACALAGALFP